MHSLNGFEIIPEIILSKPILDNVKGIEFYKQIDGFKFIYRPIPSYEVKDGKYVFNTDVTLLRRTVNAFEFSDYPLQASLNYEVMIDYVIRTVLTEYVINRFSILHTENDVMIVNPYDRYGRIKYNG